ncbi:MAG: 4'-phosphopantetheinyl transferase superfamily protein [Pseudomonadota bacterium]
MQSGTNYGSNLSADASSSRFAADYERRSLGQDPPALAEGEVHVWRLSLAEPALARAPEDYLDAEERARAARFARPELAERFSAAHAQMRAVLGGYLGVPPTDLRFGAGAQGKPALSAPAQPWPLDFNLSHSGERALLAVGRGGPLGVDIEATRIFDTMDDLARRIFAPAETAALEALAPARRVAGFFACWTRKEAVVKADGRGLSLPLESFVVRVDPDMPAALLRTDGLADPPPALHDLPAPAGYRAAIAVPQATRAIRCFALA